jgi:hypothetical protein
VIVRGTTKADANGKVGLATRFDDSAGRYVVKLDDGRLLRLKPQNLLEATPQAEAQALAVALAPASRPPAPHPPGTRPTFLGGGSSGGGGKSSRNGNSRPSFGRSLSALGLRTASANNVAPSDPGNASGGTNEPANASGRPSPRAAGAEGIGSRLAMFERGSAQEARAKQAPRRVRNTRRCLAVLVCAFSITPCRFSHRHRSFYCRSQSLILCMHINLSLWRSFF